MVNINRLLKKKEWTGTELGRIELANTLDLFHQSIMGIEKPKPIISKTDFQKMLNTISDPIEGKLYNGYISIHEWFAVFYAMGVGQEQQVYLNYNKLFTAITNAIVTEKIYNYIAKNSAPSVAGKTLPINPSVEKQQFTELERIVEPLSLASYSPDSEDFTNNVEEMKRARQLLTDSLYYLKGYNIALDLVSQRYKVEEFKYAKLNVEIIEEKIELLNKLAKELHKNIVNSSYYNKGIKESRSKMVQDIFCSIPLEDIKIPEKNIEKAKKDMKDFKAFKDEYFDLRFTLCYKDAQ